MKLKLPFRFRVLYVLLLAALVIVIAAIGYSNLLVQQLAKKEEQLVRFWAASYEFILGSMQEGNPQAEANFLIDHIILQQEDGEEKLFTVPAIVTDSLGNILNDNLNLDTAWTDAQKYRRLAQELAAMRSYTSEPIVIDIPGHPQYLWYRETEELRQLRRYPYIMLGVLGLFVVIVLAYVIMLQRSEQNRLWAGLAKETAHQLGTPLSGLVAWVELIRMNEDLPQAQMIADELGKDVAQLQTIAERFGKIGSEPDLQPTLLAPTLEQALAYIDSRLGRQGKVRFLYENKLPEGTHVMLSPTLFVWVIENLLKNALYAMADRQGTIAVRVERLGREVYIDVEDEGKGILRKDLKRVFRPGFTTKKRGWGLGLSLARRIVERFHGGKIYVVRSVSEKGTLFRIMLPIGSDA